MTNKNNWRDAKIPQWVKDSAKSEIEEDATKAALSWPKRERPTPADFYWMGYDVVKGVVVPGTYYVISDNKGDSTNSIREIHIKQDDENHNKLNRNAHSWLFSHDGQNWNQNIIRGNLYMSAEDAVTALHWILANEFAQRILRIHKQLEK